MPQPEREVQKWIKIAIKDGFPRAKELIDEELDEDDAREMAAAVQARLPPAASAAPAPGRPQRTAPARPAPRAASDLPEPTSPYRFVELNRVVIPAPEAVREASLDIPLPGGFSGEISVDWVVETPLLIGEEHAAGQQQEVVPLTMGAAGKFAIPGATLKGLLRAGVEIVTLGRLSQLNREHRFGVRDFNDPYYRENSAGANRLDWEKLGAGWLEKHEASPEEAARGLSDYRITPCDKRTVRIRVLPGSWFPDAASEGARHLDWLRRDLARKYAAAGMYASSTYDFSPARAHRFVVTDNNDVAPAHGDEGTPGTYVFSGPLPLPKTIEPELDGEDRVPKARNKKKREYVFFDRPDAKPVRVPTVVFDAFELINSTPSGRGLQPAGSWCELQPVVAAGGRIPVFILGDPASPRFDFGLTRTFKIAHSQSVGDVLDARTGSAHRLRSGMKPDWAEALFGSVVEADDLLLPGEPRPRLLPGEALPPSALARKGRVAVGFALAAEAAVFPPANKEPIHTTMMGPRASFAPHYLVGPKKHWSDRDAGLAGRKRYFPRFTGGDPPAARAMVVAGHTLPPANSTDGTVSRLRFLVPAAGQADVRFTGAIRVHNVLPEELGALLWVLTHGGAIGGPFRHMIGRAKAFGAGQSRVAEVRLKLRGHDAAADNLLDKAVPLRRFLAAFESAMDKAVKAVGLRGGWKDQAQVQEWLGLSDPDWGQQQRIAGHATYPGGVLKDKDGVPIGIDMSGGPRAHSTLRSRLGQTDVGLPRWLPTPRQLPKPG